MLFFPTEDIEDIIGADEQPTSCVTCDGIFPAAALYPKGNCAACDAKPADEALTFHCGHCAHTCHFNELTAGKCPRCDTPDTGVLVIQKPEKWAERHDAILQRPQPEGVNVDGWQV